MGLKPGSWVDLGDGRAARISFWNDATGVAIAKTPTGSEIERPTSFASTRWRPLPESGLRVAAATDPDLISKRSRDNPEDIVVLALHEFGGRAETKELRAVISPLVVPSQDWEAWWRRVQTRLEDEPRVDASRAREKQYSLATTGITALGRTLVSPLRDETRRGRRMADSPQLKRARDRARDRARAKTPFDTDDTRLLEAEFAIASDPRVDPTDRFMAAELGVWLGRWTDIDARAALGADLLAVDLLRIPQHQSRTLALEWALTFVQDSEASSRGGVITFQSAAATGAPWWDRVASALGSGPALKDAAFGILGWSIPGDEDAGDAKLKDDLPTFEKRIDRAEALISTLPGDAVAGLWEGAIHGLRSLPESQIYGPQISSLCQRIARAAWKAFARLEAQRRPRLQELDPMPRDRVAMLIRSGSLEAVEDIRHAVVRWYSADPTPHAPTLRVLAERIPVDPLALGLEAVQQVLDRTTVPRIAKHLFHDVEDAKRSDELAAAVVNLAVTALKDDPAVDQGVDRFAEAIIESYRSGRDTVGPVTFTRSSWERFSNLVRAQLEETTAQEAAARRQAEEYAAEAKRQRELAETRSAALTEVRSSAGSAVRQDTGRLAANLLKPVAMAVGDSYESNSLEALQDRILGILGRARIAPILETGEVTVFDPSRHQWVGDGIPTERVEARSPGFVLESEGEDGIVLVPARVVAARE